jgi:hypothetical protein
MDTPHTGNIFLVTAMQWVMVTCLISVTKDQLLLYNALQRQRKCSLNLPKIVGVVKFDDCHIYGLANEKRYNWKLCHVILLFLVSD